MASSLSQTFLLCVIRPLRARSGDETKEMYGNVWEAISYLFTAGLKGF